MRLFKRLILLLLISSTAVAGTNWNVDTSGNLITLGDISIYGGKDIKLYSNSGSTLKFTVDAATGNTGIISGAKLFFDGVNFSGDTYIVEGSANTLDFYAGGANGISLTTALFEIGIDTSLGAGHSLILDGIGGNDRIINSANGQNDFYANGILAMRTTSSGGVTFPTVPLAVTSGGTGVTTSTGTTNVVLSGSPTIVTPTIASFTNATHDHQSAAGGGTLSGNAITSNITGTGNVVKNNGPTLAGTVTVGSGATAAIIPNQDNVFDLGTTSARFQNIFLLGKLGNSTSSYINFSSGTHVSIVGMELALPAVDPPTANDLNQNSGAKAWISKPSSGTGVNSSYNVSSVTHTNGTGSYTINWNTNFSSSTSYAITCSPEGNPTAHVSVTTKLADHVVVSTEDDSYVLTDRDFSCIAMGLQ